MNTSIKKTLLSLGALAMLTVAGFANQTVITLGNQTSGNALELYSANNGTLTKTSSIPTGGNGLGLGLGSQYGIAYDNDTHILAAVNAGSNSVSLFRVDHGTPELINTIPSGGVRPVSVALRGNALYVLNQGDANNPSSISGFHVVFGGTTPVDVEPALSTTGYVNPAQIEFSPNGRYLVVTEKATNKIDVYGVNMAGDVTSSNSYAAAGTTPFGFEFDNDGHLFVSEAFGGAANASALSSYHWSPTNGLKTISGSVATNQTAACWVAVTPNGRFAFTTNAGSGSVSSFKIADNGSLKLSSNSAPITGSTPIDAATDRQGKNLFVLQAGASMIQSYKIANDGSLTATTSVTTPNHSGGLVVLD